MKNLQSFEDYSVNEGLFDKLTGSFSKFFNMFKDPAKLMKATQDAIAKNETKAAKFLPKNLKVNDVINLAMGDGKNPAADFTITISKLANLPDGSSLFQIIGTTSPMMLKSLTNSNKIEDLSKNSLMMLVSAEGFIKGKPIVIKLLKNIFPDGKNYTSAMFFQGFADQLDVEKNILKS